MPEPRSPSSDEPSESRLELGRQLRDLRISREWTLHELAARVGMSISSLSAYERGTRSVSLDDLAVLCDAYNLLVSDFLSGVPPYGRSGARRRG
jgi:transcriptional regulator with XRE-family HTH domain